MQFKSGGQGGGVEGLIKLKSGESVTGILRGEPHEFEHAFKPADKPKFRFRLNMVVSENGALVAKVLEGGWKLYVQLKTLSEAGWDLEKTYTKISRQGSTMNDTTYSATVIPTTVPEHTLLKVIEVELRVLDTATHQNTPAAVDPDFESAPF